MNKRAVMLAASLVIAVATLAAAILFDRPSRRTGGPLRHEVYVWQRAWSQPVRTAASQHVSNFSAVVVLKNVISWKDQKPTIARVAVDYDTLLATKRPIGIALRIEPYAGPFTTNDPAAAFVVETAAALIAEVQSNHIELAELQIDFDCAESKLDGYRIWLEAIQQRVAPLPVTITTLPSWLDSRAFRRLAAVATNYVLQVHSVERPKTFSARFTLCDPRTASRAVEQAGRIGVPFRVALPTYGYLMAFDSAGKFLGLAAEGPRPNWPTNAQIREVSTDPIEIAALVQSWARSRPIAMNGVIWYRLPVNTDKHNWDWKTLDRTMQSNRRSQ